MSVEKQQRSHSLPCIQEGHPELLCHSGKVLRERRKIGAVGREESELNKWKQYFRKFGHTGQMVNQTVQIISLL